MDLPSGVRVHGSEGFVEVNWDGDIRRAVVFRDPSWTPPKIEERPENHMFGVIRNAFDCLESGAEPELSWRKALRAEEIIFALYESVRRRAAVELPLTGVTDNPFHTLLHQGAFASAKGARGRALAKIAGESIVLSQVADGAWAGSNLAEIFPATGDTRMACGIHELFASETVVEKAPVDDVLYILEGEIEIDADGVVETYRAGDVAYLRAGSRQKFTVRERVKHLYVTDPCDWSNG